MSKNIAQRPDTATWMDEEPSDAEIYRAISAMKTGKAAGEDGFSAEYLKYGGDALRGQVYAVVRQMWNQAIGAPAGREGKEWPQEWNIGLVIPLWKRKGLRTDKNTWMGDYTLERRLQIDGTRGGLTCI